jgi:hypothetical protein
VTRPRPPGAGERDRGRALYDGARRTPALTAAGSGGRALAMRGRSGGASDVAQRSIARALSPGTRPLSRIPQAAAARGLGQRTTAGGTADHARRLAESGHCARHAPTPPAAPAVAGYNPPRRTRWEKRALARCRRRNRPESLRPPYRRAAHTLERSACLSARAGAEGARHATSPACRNSQAEGQRGAHRPRPAGSRPHRDRVSRRTQCTAPSPLRTPS